MVELIVTAINVFILFFLIGYLVSDMLSGMLTKRQERIADDINTARMSKEEALATIKDMYDSPNTQESCTDGRENSAGWTAGG